MTESLTERLQQRLSSQTAEIEALTSAELTRLASSLKQQSEAALRTIEHFQTQLLRSLNTHSEQTMSLVKQVNALLDE